MNIFIPMSNDPPVSESIPIDAKTSLNLLKDGNQVVDIDLFQISISNQDFPPFLEDPETLFREYE
jgi:hypothetical protein